MQWYGLGIIKFSGLPFAHIRAFLYCRTYVFFFCRFVLFSLHETTTLLFVFFYHRVQIFPTGRLVECLFVFDIDQYKPCHPCIHYKEDLLVVRLNVSYPPVTWSPFILCGFYCKLNFGRERIFFAAKHSLAVLETSLIALGARLHETN